MRLLSLATLTFLSRVIVACGEADESGLSRGKRSTDPGVVAEPGGGAGASGVPADGAGSETGDGTNPGPSESVDGGTPSSSDIDVIVGSGAMHLRVVSIDLGKTWCQTGHERGAFGDPYDNPLLLRNVTYANGKFITGSERAIWVSDNGYAWKNVFAAGPGQRQWIGQITFGNGYWVAVGGQGTIWRSADLTDWKATQASTDHFRHIAFGDGKFVAVRSPSSSAWWESADAISWKAMNVPSAKQDEGVIFDGKNFVVRPGYDEGAGVALRVDWPGGVSRRERAGAWAKVSFTAPEPLTRFAFGRAKRADYEKSKLPAELATCLKIE